MTKRYDVLLFGYYGFGNLGDELLARACVELLTDAGTPKDKIAVLSAKPAEYEKSLGVAAFDRGNPLCVLRALRAAKTLLLGGGGLFQDVTSKRSVAYYFAVVAAARLLGAKVWAVGQSIGPLSSPFAKKIARVSLSLASYLSVRDESSLKLAASFGIKADFSPDVALTLPVRNYEGTNAGKPFVIFNARPGYEKISLEAAAFCRKLAAENGCRVVGVALSAEDVREIERLRFARQFEIDDIITADGLSAFSKASRGAFAAVGMRLHFLELAALCSVPSVGCAYDPKVSGFCEMFGVPIVGEAARPARVEKDKLEKAGAEARKKFNAGLRAVLGDTNG